MPKEYFEKKGNKRSGGGPFEMGSYGQGKNPIMNKRKMNPEELKKAKINPSKNPNTEYLIDDKGVMSTTTTTKKKPPTTKKYKKKY